MVEVPNMENHKFEAYQIFTGTQEKRDKDDAPLADIAWGTGIKGDAFLTASAASPKPAFSRFSLTSFSTLGTSTLTVTVTSLVS